MPLSSEFICFDRLFSFNSLLFVIHMVFLAYDDVFRSLILVGDAYMF